MFAPPDVVLAVYGAWLSLLLSAAFAIHEIAVSASILDPVIRVLVFVGIIASVKALQDKHIWARYCLMALLVFFYLFLALDADGLTRSDFWHMLCKTPLDLYVLSRLCKPAVSAWLKQ